MEEARRLLEIVLSEDSSPAMMGAFLGMVGVESASPSALAGFVKLLRERMIGEPALDCVDTCGTGGGIPSLNISTAAAFIVAGAGVQVAKHGNRAVTSKVGSADVLEALGLPIPVPNARLLLDEIGVSFFFAPAFHPGLARIGPVRRELGFRTVFNLLGPMLNPASAKRQVIGAWSPGVARSIAGALALLDAEEVRVVHGLVGLDEVSPVGETLVLRVRDGEVAESIVSPETFGLRRVEVSALTPGADAREGAERLRLAISDPKSEAFAAVAPSAALTLVVATGCDPVSAGRRVIEVVESGAALAKLDSLVQEALR
jgi:anthranilate phosphoribosyltransferase